VGWVYEQVQFSEIDELIERARAAGGVYSSQIRDEANYPVGVLAAVQEVIDIAERAGVRGIVSHVKALGPDNWGMSAAIVSRIERARDRGVDVVADQYPYTASSTSLAAALVPRWAQAGGTAEFRARLADPSTRTRIVDG